jgi:hypothetical protein
MGFSEFFPSHKHHLEIGYVTTLAKPTLYQPHLPEPSFRQDCQHTHLLMKRHYYQPL